MEGLPNFSISSKNAVDTACSNPHSDTILLVSDWRFGNYDIAKLQSGLIFTDTSAKANNIHGAFITPSNDTFLIAHQIKILQQYLEIYPRLKFIWWCLFTRTCYGSHFPIIGSYDEIVKTFRDNTLDIRHWCSQADFKNKMIRDSGGHPSADGYDLLLKMLLLSTKQKNRTN